MDQGQPVAGEQEREETAGDDGGQINWWLLAKVAIVIFVILFGIRFWYDKRKETQAEKAENV